MIVQQDQRYIPCEACALVDGDYGSKLCTYCKFCDAWLCASCKALPMIHPRRLAAAAKKKLTAIFS